MDKLDIGSDYFTTADYPDVIREVRLMVYHVSEINGRFKQEILISYLKNRSIKVDWLVDNDSFVQMITSGSLISYHTERLFESKRRDKLFLNDFEGYIKTELANCPSNASHRNVLNVLPSPALLTNLHYYACSSDAA